MSLTYNQAVEQTITAGEQIHQIVNGTATTEVTVEDGSRVPSIRKALLDNFYFKDPIAWQVGQTENVFNQLRKFTDGSWWYAPSATASNPVSMGVTPVGDPLWKIYDFDAIGKLTPQIREALRRSYAEAGYALVAGSFEKGGTVATGTDVLLYEAEGKAYSWDGAFPPSGKGVPPDSSPLTTGGIAVGAWVSRFDSELRDSLSSNTGAGLIGTPFPYGTLLDHISRDSGESEYGLLTEHTKKRLSKRYAKVALVGDSLSTIYNIDSVNQTATFATHLRRRIMEMNPSAKFYNRAIGGMRYFDLGKPTPAITTYSPSYPWYTDVGRRWMDYLTDLMPDIIVLAFGMNDGNGWDVGNFQQGNFFKMMDDLRSIPSHPDIVFCTNILPSNENPSTSDEAAQTGRDAMAGWTRSYSQRLGYSYIDLHRRFKMLRDGVDPNVMYYAKKTTQRTITLPYEYTDLHCDSYSARIEVVDPVTATTGVQFQLSSYPNNFLSIRYDGAYWVTTVYTGLSSDVGVSIRAVGIGPVPTIGTKISFVMNGNTVTVFIGDNTEPVFNEQVFRFGNAFTPKIGGTGTVKLDMMVGTLLPYQASLTDSEIYSPAAEDGGNDLNHPNARSSSIIYGRPLDSVFSSDSRRTAGFDVVADFVNGSLVVNSAKNPELGGVFKLTDVITVTNGALQFSRNPEGNAVGVLVGATNRFYIDGAKLLNLPSGISSLEMEVDCYVPSAAAYVVSFGETMVSDRIITQFTPELYRRGTVSSGGVSSDMLSSSLFPYTTGSRVTLRYKIDCSTHVVELSEPDGFRRGALNTHNITNLSSSLFSKMKFGYAGTSTFGVDIVISAVRLRMM